MKRFAKVVLLLLVVILSIIVFKRTAVESKDVELETSKGSIIKEEIVSTRITYSPKQEEIVINQEDTTNYLQEMIYACVNNDREKGLLAESARNSKIVDNNLDREIIYYDDLYLLSKVITNEAGSDWVSDELQLYVGNVLINRVNSVEFPDTIHDCVHQEGQYSGVNTKKFEDLTPTLSSVNNAILLLEGNTYLPETVVFQANFPQGSGVYLEIYDEILRTTTYLCYSNYPELYEE